MQLFSGLEANTFVDQYQVKTWSKELGREALLATLELDEQGMLHVIPSDAGAVHYASLGLQEAADGSYVINIHEAPKTLVAKTLGLPGGDASFEFSLAQAVGRTPTAFDILEIALQGHPSQSGRLVNADEKGSRFVKIDENQFVSATSTNIPDFNDLYVRAQSEYQGLVKTDVLIKDGSNIVPAYVVTVQQGAHENVTDRLAVYAATLEEAAKMNNIIADRPLRFVTTHDGQPALICQDATRPEFGIVAVGQSARNAAVTLVSLEHSLLHAKSFVEPAGAFQREQDKAVIRSLTKANALREFAQDSQGLGVSVPGRISNGVESGVQMGRLDIPRHVTVESLAAAAQTSQPTLAGPVAALSKRISLDTVEVSDQVSQAVKAVSRRAAVLAGEIDKMVAANLTTSEPERQTTTYDLYDLN